MNRVGLVGVSPIADWHVRALREAGLQVTAVSTRAGSTRLAVFAERHGIPSHPDWRAMFKARDQWDGLVLATSVGSTPEVLTSALALDVPILVEKPVGWRAAEVVALAKAAPPRVMVGYNRRFYRTAQIAREEARKGPPLLAHLALPESIRPVDGDPGRQYLRPFLENSCHGWDLTRFVLSPLSVSHVDRVLDDRGRLIAMAALLKTSRGDLVQFTANWGTPANFALTLHRPGRRFELLPFEVATVYEGMDVLDPNDEFPIRRYLPKAIDRVLLDEIDLREKPGFVRQAEAFARVLAGGAPPEFAATLADAAATLTLCEELLGPHVPSV